MKNEAIVKQVKDSYVFISYSSADRTEANGLYEKLTNRFNRLTCWMDVYDLIPDDETFQEQIIHGIRNASGFVLVDTPAAAESDYVNRELGTAESDNVPVFRYKTRQGASRSMQAVQTMLLARRIKARISRPLWASILILAMTLILMGAAVFFVSKNVTPGVVEAYNRLLPEAAADSDAQEMESGPGPSDTAPFYFEPEMIVFQEDFMAGDELNPYQFYYDIQPSCEEVEILQHDGSLVLNYPAGCSTSEYLWSCETEIHSYLLNLETIEYIGMRVRLQNSSDSREISISLSSSTSDRRRTGFGWAFSTHAAPFFRSNINLPEEDYYAYVPVEDEWHAYEIILDPDTRTIHYYMDGQLLDSYIMQYYEEWEDAPLMLLIYSTGNDMASFTKSAENQDMMLVVDRVVLGRFNK